MADQSAFIESATLKDPVASLAGQVRHASTGTLARLRRFDPLTYPRAALFDYERIFQAAGITAQGAERERWALVLHCIALVQGRHDSRAEAEPGKVLYGIRFSEARLEQLVAADKALLFTLMPRVARRLAAAGATVNWRPLADLLLGTDSDDPQRASWADQARQRLVRQFIGAQGLAEAETHHAPDQEA